MFISQLTTSAFDEFHFREKLLPAVGATKERGHSFCMMGQIGKHFIRIKFVKVYQTVFGIFPLGVHVSLQFNEFYLAILRTVFHCQIKRLSKQFQLNFVFSEILKSVWKLIPQLLYTSSIFSPIQVRKFQFPGCKTHEIGQCDSTQLNLEKFQFFLKSANMPKQLNYELTFPLESYVQIRQTLCNVCEEC